MSKEKRCPKFEAKLEKRFFIGSLALN